MNREAAFRAHQLLFESRWQAVFLREARGRLLRERSTSRELPCHARDSSRGLRPIIIPMFILSWPFPCPWPSLLPCASAFWPKNRQHASAPPTIHFASFILLSLGIEVLHSTLLLSRPASQRLMPSACRRLTGSAVQLPVVEIAWIRKKTSRRLDAGPELRAAAEIDLRVRSWLWPAELQRRRGRVLCSGLLGRCAIRRSAAHWDRRPGVHCEEHIASRWSGVVIPEDKKAPTLGLLAGTTSVYCAQFAFARRPGRAAGAGRNRDEAGRIHLGGSRRCREVSARES